MILQVFGWKIKVTNSTQLSNMGEYSYKDKEIKLHAKYKGKQRDIILCHEIIHCVIHRLGLNNAELSHDLEEILADNIATAINENADLKWKRHK